ncbi:hypothetical protein BC936DRAFT_148788 [Jimgerdemannia flammicorona]|uniref:Uncharacterized protein n=1 Tax=Jimgerdemannia flammicorona TaxID=994334 RepID=A0A433D2A3_9FUNG|nr:hypothetical protein BC936DRAFT_148788 [Jimgerdemannia flammicorona]
MMLNRKGPQTKEALRRKQAQEYRQARQQAAKYIAPIIGGLLILFIIAVFYFYGFEPRKPGNL